MSGRIQLLKIKRKGAIITIVNVYGLNVENERDEFLNKLLETITAYDYGDSIVIAGDFNILLDNKLDKHGGQLRQYKSQEKLNSIIHTQNLVDIWRYRYKTSKILTNLKIEKTLAKRIEKMLPSIIHQDQSGF